ncbi:MAG: hypothetical protein Q7U34_13475 [Anaerolineales bacterium]|nr:hypothetical protein [Anaerolineales bacterium]
MVTATQAPLQAEEQLVAELKQLGVRYLSRQSDAGVVKGRAPQELLADLVRQPSSRVRVALIALLLARPDYAAHVHAALKNLTHEQAQTFKFFYTAAVCLQQQYAKTLQVFLGNHWLELPDLFSNELEIMGNSPTARLRALARLHVQRTGMHLNWAGTYENAARHLLRCWEMERTWKQ